MKRLFAKYWSKICLAGARVAALVRQIARPTLVVRTVMTRSSVSTSSGLTEEELKAFEALVKKFDESVIEFQGLFPSLATRLNYSLSFQGVNRVVEQHLLSCPWCGRRNRLRGGSEGATCGSCKKPLSPLVHHTNQKR